MKLRTNAEKGRCSRSWEIEAARDGRLSGDALEETALHVETCAECRSLSDSLDGLGAALRAYEPRVDETVLPRLRREVLAATDAEMTGRSVPPSRHHVPRRWPLALVAALAVALVVVGWRRHAASSSSATATATAIAKPASSTSVEAVDEGGARWSRATASDVEFVDLSDGTLRLRVNHVPGSRRVIVRVPDGEIEDVGTTFHVVVAHGRTERVGVDEGRVTIRLAQMAPITISSGSTWERPANEPARAAAPSVAPPPPAAAPAKEDGTSFAAVKHAPRAAAAPTASLDATQEDEAYLATIRLLREGRDVEARAAAREYLRRFPDGFRREEMARVVREENRPLR